MSTYRELWHNTSASYHKEVVSDGEEIVVKAKYSLISAGTERSMITSLSLSKATAERMRVPFMKGQFGQDFTYGYSLVGEVVKGPAHLNNKSVHLLHPHQELAFVDEHSLHLIPVGIDLKQSTLASNLETAINAIWDAQVELGDRVVIVGYGLIGALIAKLCQSSIGVEVLVSEANKERASLAELHGFQLCNQDTEDMVDVAFHTSGSSEGLQFSIDKVRKEGKVIELSWYGDREVIVRLGDSFHYDRKMVISSQVSSIPTRKHQMWDYKKRKKLVFDLLAQIDFSHLIQRSVPFSEAPVFFNELRQSMPSEIGIMIDYN